VVFVYLLVPLKEAIITRGQKIIYKSQYRYASKHNLPADAAEHQGFSAFGQRQKSGASN